MLSVRLFWLSLHFGILAVARFYDFHELQNNIGFYTNVTGLLFWALIGYLCIYFVWKAFMAHKAKRVKAEEEGLQY